MQQFVAILKDSFREAVDGFVIYLMLALSALVILLIASVSYTPDPGDRVLGDADGMTNPLKRFAVIFPDRGASAAPTGVPGVRYEAADVEQAGPAVSFTLVAGRDKNQPDLVNALNGGDGFRYAVYAWQQPAGKKVDLGVRGKGRGRGATDLEVVEPPPATADGLKAVTDEQMAAFLRYQFVTFVGVKEADVAVTRRAGVAEPEYQFDVRLGTVAGARGWPHTIRVFFGASGPIKGLPLGTTLYVIQDIIVNGIGAAVTLMLSVVVTAFFVPNMLRKGSLDLLISKPIGRVRLLVYKYVGGLLFIFLVSAFTIGGVWVAMGAQSGLWDPRFLLVIPLLTFTFAIVYAVSTAVAVFTRSAIASILVSLAFMLGLYVLGKAKSFFDANRLTKDFELPEWSYTLVDVLNNVFPRYKDMDKLTSRLIADGTVPVGDARLQGLFVDYPSWGGAIGVSLAFIVLMLGAASWRLAKRDG